MVDDSINLQSNRKPSHQGEGATVKNTVNGLKLFQLIPSREFSELCEKWKINKRVKTLTAQKQVWALILAYLCKLESLREVEFVLGIAKSTLSDANANREAQFFEELCRIILWKILQRARARKVRQSIRTILAMDSTECTVHGSLAKLPKWKQKSSKGKTAGAKLHVIWDINGEWIEEFRVTPVRVHDQPAAKILKIRANCTYVFDRAYNEALFWWQIINKGSHLVTRLKQMPRYRMRTFWLIKEKQNDVGVLWDGKWKPSEVIFYKNPQIPKEFSLRHIVYRDPETKKIFNFITSDSDSPAQRIADIYKKRWAVELLFRWMKGHLRIRALSPRNTNAIHIQLTVAVLVQLLVKLYQLLHKIKGSLWDCLRALRVKLTLIGVEALKYGIFEDFSPKTSPGVAISL